MSIFTTFKDHRGKPHKTNTALVVLTSMYIVGAAVAFSAPYWVSATSALAPLAAFTVTPLGIGILATVAVALIGLAVYSVITNKKLSEVKSPKIINYRGTPVVLLSREVLEEIKKSNKYTDEKGKEIQGKYYIDFRLKDNNYRVILDDKSSSIVEGLGNTLLMSIASLEVKNKEGKFVKLEAGYLATLGLDKDDAKEVNPFLGEISVNKVDAQKKEK